MHELLQDIQRKAAGSSPIHHLDAGVKLLSVLVIIAFAVLTEEPWGLLLLEFFVLVLMALARLPPMYVGKRLLLILPFGGFIAIFQPFIRPGDVVWSFYWLQATHEGVVFTILLFLRLLVCISGIILLSSTTPLNDLFRALRRFRVPTIFIALLDMMIRYLGLCFENLHMMLTAQKARGFRWRKNRSGYRFVLKTAGNILGTFFAKSMDRSERIYESMIARGYESDSSYSFNGKRSLHAGDASFLLSVLLITVIIHYHGLIIGNTGFL
jgi:cobalt/nickel transport system permease protein